MTTHYLDEADLLADHIVMLSKGRLRAEGSSVELKETLGAGYKVTVPAVAARDAEHHADGLEGVEKTVASDDSDDVTFVAHSSALAAQLVRRLEDAGLHQYDFAGPSIEDVFLRVADEVKEDDDECASASAEPGEKCAARRGEGGAAKGRLGLLPGARTSFLTQFRTLLHKRLLVFGSNCFPNAAALAIPIIAAGLTTLCIKGLGPVLCGKGDDTFTAGNNQIGAFEGAALNYIVAGPSSKFANDTVEALFVPIMQAEFAGRGPQLVANAAQSLLESLHLVDTYDDFTQHVVDFRTNITPAGIWLGDASSEPTLAYLGNGELNLVVSGQNVMNVMLLNTPITANYGWFNYPWLPSTDSSLQMLAYFGLAMCAFPAFFALYPNTERRRRVRSLEYSNGVRFYPLWLAYLSFDLAFAMVGIALACGIYSATSGIWYGSVGYLFVVFTLYALASILLGYVVSLFCGSQLSTYAFTTAGQAAFFLIYLIVYFCTLTYTPVTRLDSDLLLVHFLVSAFAPIGSVIRALFVTLNLFSAACDGFDLSPHPGGIRLYGGPILYLILQSLLLFVVLIWVDSGAAKTWWDKVGQRLWYHRVLFGRGPRRPAAMRSRPDTAVVSDEEVAEMALAVTAPTEEMPPGSAIDAGRRNPDGLRVLNVSRSFGRNLAIDNATFGVRHGEVFALLGPNGAGKSTLISLICGDLRPDAGQRGGDILVGDASVVTRLAAARARLGVCPQLDAIDQLTVRQHLAFFAAVQGVASRRGGGAQDSNVTAVLRAVGLSAYADRWAASLSGGNKRKLALGIALLGDPDVVLLDEPSSGLDAAAKRVMWRTLRRAGAGRSVLLTTHSLEEADALAGRVGILARRMLAVGTPEELRRRFRDRVLVHLVLATAPRTGREEMEHVRTRLLELFPGAEVEKRMDFGQARVLVPQGDVLARARKRDPASLPAGNAPAPEDVEAAAAPTERSAVGQLVVMLEELKQELGIRSYSVSATTLDQVFLAIVGRHDKVQEENSTPPSTRQASAR